MTTKETVRDLFEGFLAGKRSYEDVFHKSFVSHNGPKTTTREEFISSHKARNQQASYQKPILEEILEDGDKAAVRWTLGGHRTYVAMLRVKDGKIAERWGSDIAST